MTNYYQIIVSSPGPQGPPGPTAASVSYATVAGSAASATVSTSATYSSSAGYSSSAALVTSASGIPTRWYGSFYSSATQTIANTASSYPMLLGNTDYSNDVVNGDNGSITFLHSGIYNVQWSGQFRNTSNGDQDVYVWLKKNGSNYPGSTGLVSVPSAHGGTDGHTIAGWNYILSMNAGENIQFYWGAQSTAVTLQYYASATNPTRPDTVSLIVTAVQV